MTLSLNPASRLARARAALARWLRGGKRSSRASLRTTIAILKAQQEATLDGILVVDTEGKILSYNRRFLEIWGVPTAAAATADDNELLGYAAERVVDWDDFIELVNHLYTHPDEVRTDDRVELTDGRVFSRASVPVRSGNAITGRAWYFRDVSESVKGEVLQSALFRIAQLSREVERLEDFYPAVHRVVSTLMDATNFYIASYDPGRHLLTFPYFVDECDSIPPGGVPVGRGLTAYVIRTGEPLLVDPEKFEELRAAEEVESVGAPSIDWVGVPLKSSGGTWGVMGVQTYRDTARYTQRDLDVLVFVSQHVAAAVEERRKDLALRDSERRYRQMFENNRAVQLIIDPENGAILDANMAAADFYGYDIEQFRSMRIWDINVAGPERVREEMANAAVQDRTYFVFRHMRSNGELRDVEVHSGPLEIGGRTVLYSIIHDITERRAAEAKLASVNAQRKAVLDAATRVAIIATDPRGMITMFNSGAERMLGYGAAEMIGVHTVIELHRDEELGEHAARLAAELGERLSGFDVLVYRAMREEVEEREWTYIRSDGSPMTVLLSVTSIRGEDGAITGFLHVANDVTERKQTEEMLRQQSAAIAASMDGIGILDERLQFTYLNDALARLYDVQPQSMLGHPLRDLYDQHENDRFQRTILPMVGERGRWRGEASGLRRDGALFPQEISLTAIEGGGLVCVVRDITERTYAEEQIKHLAYHDALTGLPNRLLFKDRLTVALSHAQRDHTRLAVLFLDLDRFKVINDSLGHNIGDQLLQAVAARVQSCVRESDTVARLGGDEFTLLLPALARSDDAAPVAQKLLEAVRYPFHLEGREFFITTSIGISLYPEDGLDAETLIKNADTAMYQAKEQGRDNYQLFNAYINAKALQRIAPSPSSISAPAASAGWRPCCAGAIRRWATSLPACSSHWLRPSAS